MELPPYRMPTAKVVLRNMWNKSYEYIRKVGGTILVAVIIIWSLGYFPRNSELDTQKEQEIASVVSNSDSYTNPTAVIDSISNEYKSKHFEQSYLRSIGTAIEPILRPAGIDWQLGVSIVTGIAAKEVIISTLSVIYHVNDDNEDNTSLKEILIAKSKNDESGINTLICAVVPCFVLIYFPCVGVVVAVKKRQTAGNGPLFLVAYTTILRG